MANHYLWLNNVVFFTLHFIKKKKKPNAKKAWFCPHLSLTPDSVASLKKRTRYIKYYESHYKPKTTAVNCITDRDIDLYYKGKKIDKTKLVPSFAIGKIKVLLQEKERDEVVFIRPLEVKIEKFVNLKSFDTKKAVELEDL